MSIERAVRTAHLEAESFIGCAARTSQEPEQ
jgi:hypothetical protein